MKTNQLLQNLFYPTCSDPSITVETKKIIFHRNKAVGTVFALLLPFFTVLKFTMSSIPQPVHNHCVIHLLLILSVILLTCRKYPGFFSLYYTLLAIVFGPTLPTESFIYPYCFVFVAPSFVMVISERWYYTLTCLVCQLYYLVKYLSPRMLEYLNTRNPEEIVNSFVAAGFFFSLLMPTILLINDYRQSRYRELREEAKQLEYAYQKQNRFLLSLSHELRNPLNSMLGNIQLALFEEIPQKVRGVLEDAHLCGDILLHLVNNILDSGKASIGKLEVNPSISNIYTTCEKIWGISSRLIAHKGLFGSLRIDKKVPPYLQLDCYRLTQIMLNLIGNSVKFTMKGEIRVDINWIPDMNQVEASCFEPIPFDEEDEGIFEKQQSMTVLEDTKYDMLTLGSKSFRGGVYNKNNLTRNEKGILKISVTDTGCGMKESDLAQLFQQFVQVNNDSLKRNVGSGLGLYITKEIVEKLGGQIKAFSKFGQGSVFTVCLPTTSSPNFEISSNINQPISQFRIKEDLRVLVVDDVSWNAHVFVNYLKRLKETPVVAVNGLDALQKYQNAYLKGEPFDVIIMDYDMPVMNGKEALTEIRKYEEMYNLKPSVIIIVSGHVDQRIIDECLNPEENVRADHFLRKPVSFEQLQQVLTKI